MKKIFHVDSEFCIRLEKLMFDVNAHKDLCAFLIDHGMDKTESFEKYHSEYIKAYTEYEKEKSNLTAKYLSGYSNYSWFLNFDKCELEVTINE